MALGEFPPSPVREKHTHLQFKCLSANNKFCYLAYIDPRRFGKLYFLKGKALIDRLQGLGVDLMSPEFTPDYIQMVFKRFPARKLKPFLLEQKYISGIGNYMASEICALAHILPTRRLHQISFKEIKKLHRASIKVVDRQLKHQGLSFSGGYKDAHGQRGEGLDHFVVFHRDSCGACGGPVKKETIAGRGSFYCRSCQS